MSMKTYHDSVVYRDFKKEYPAYKKDRLKISYELSYRASGCEAEDFVYCEGCGTRFGFALLLSDLEIDYWE